ncbi:GNAT family N-acetyltransferase [Halobacteria archaeon AArc-m2/3/4]|uniref:GNAT family N-acetyltransferase n=1 Tax=Natronoglomus mannanivorans TaxID=2979990 RepID=A0ABT2QHY3_9EURY|nr:GNAT family N-acetyltransferase [Halobacteria archaeon AArc-m2/3/4]
MTASRPPVISDRATDSDARSDASPDADTTRQSWDHTDCEGSVYCPPRCPRFVDKTGTALLVRSYGPNDYEDLVAMYETFAPAQRAQGLPPQTPARLESWLEIMLEEGNHVVAVLDGRIVGHAFYTPVGHEEPELAVFVHQRFHDRGIGTELCKHVIAFAAAGGHDALVLDVEKHNRAAVSVYRALGFDAADRRGRELHMRLPLSDPIATQVQRPPAANA